MSPKDYHQIKTGANLGLNAGHGRHEQSSFIPTIVQGFDPDSNV